MTLLTVDQFYKHELSVEARNMIAFKESIQDPDERKSLYFDLKDLEWKSLIEHIIWEVLKEPDDNLPRAIILLLQKVTRIYNMFKVVV